jgi:hypothetical protein
MDFRFDFMRNPSIAIAHQSLNMKNNEKSVFDEKYRVVAVESDRLLLRGVLSGEVLTIINSEPDTPLTAEQYPLGKLIALSDPAATPLN